MTTYLDFPFSIAGSGRVATTSRDDQIRDMIHQVLFTNPGERVNRPDFGCGLLRLVFMPNSDVLATATQAIVQGTLQRWLDDLITVDRVQVQAVDSTLTIDVAYRRRDTGERRVEQFVESQS